MVATLNGIGISAEVIWGHVQLHHGIGTWAELVDDTRDRFGDARAEQLSDELEPILRAESRRSVFIPGHDPVAEPVLNVLPEPLFLDGIYLGMGGHVGNFNHALSQHEAIQTINELLARRGVFYRLESPSGRAEWVGDIEHFATVITPALGVLADARLSGARSEFESARIHLRNRTNKDLEDAIGESAKAVESTMKVLIDATGGTRTGKEPAHPLFELLVGGAVVEVESDQAVLGAARIRNAWDGHGAGAVPRVVPHDLADLCVSAAAAAIIYLGARLP